MIGPFYCRSISNEVPLSSIAQHIAFARLRYEKYYEPAELASVSLAVMVTIFLEIERQVIYKMGYPASTASDFEKSKLN